MPRKHRCSAYKVSLEDATTSSPKASDEVIVACIGRAAKSRLMPDEHSVKEKGNVEETGRKDCTRYGRFARHWCGNRQASGRGRSQRGHHIREGCRRGRVGRQGD